MKRRQELESELELVHGGSVRGEHGGGSSGGGGEGERVRVNERGREGVRVKDGCGQATRTPLAAGRAPVGRIGGPTRR